MRIFIEPTEPLLFRTGRPFDAGEIGYAETVFPPTPETLQGALRAMIATYWNPKQTLDEVFRDRELVDRIGNYDHYGRFRIKSLTLGRYQDSKYIDKEGITVERLFPAPAHILLDQEGIIRLRPENAVPDMESNLPEGIQLLLPEEKTDGKTKPLNGWLTEQDLLKVLNVRADISTLQAIPENDVYEREMRIGVGINNDTKTTEEGLLYQVQMIRMKSKLYRYGFVVDFRLSTNSTGSAPSSLSENFIDDTLTQKELRIPQDGWLTLGGERRSAHFVVLKNTISANKNSVEDRKSGNLLYFATPTYFKHGWQPESWRTSQVKLISAVINRYQPIGGWKLNTRDSGGSSKITRRCVPAGSVYFFEKSIEVAHPLTDYGLEIGYGISYLGDWKR